MTDRIINLASPLLDAERNERVRRGLAAVYVTLGGIAPKTDRDATVREACNALLEDMHVSRKVSVFVVLREWADDEPDIVGVYATRTAAEAAQAQSIIETKAISFRVPHLDVDGTESDHWDFAVTIEEHELKGA
jgi:hypothetical protein